MVLAYDRRTIDAIVTKFFPPCFKMAESFENLDNILRDWAKDKGIKQVRKAGREKIKPVLLKDNPGKVLEQSQSAVERE